MGSPRKYWAALTEAARSSGALSIGGQLFQIGLGGVMLPQPDGDVLARIQDNPRFAYIDDPGVAEAMAVARAKAALHADEGVSGLRKALAEFERMAPEAKAAAALDAMNDHDVEIFIGGYLRTRYPQPELEPEVVKPVLVSAGVHGQPGVGPSREDIDVRSFTPPPPNPPPPPFDDKRKNRGNR